MKDFATSDDEICDVGSNDTSKTRLSLLVGLKETDNQAVWLRFYETYRGLIFQIARRSGLDESNSEEVVQETVISVARSIGKFRYDRAKCAFRTWLYVLARRRIADRLRRARLDPLAAGNQADLGEDANIEDLIEAHAREPDPEWDQLWRQHQLSLAMQRVRGSVGGLQFQLFDAYAVKGGNALEVARAFDVSVGQVYLAKYRVGLAVRKVLRQLETEELPEAK